MPQSKHKSERGNVFLFILLGVVLFAALAFTVAKGFRSQATSSLSDRQANLAASDMIAYAQKIERAVNRLRRKGCSETEISFEHDTFKNGHAQLESYTNNSNAPTDLSCHVFEKNGGGVVPQEFPESAREPSEATNRFERHYIPLVVHLEGVGTDYASAADMVRPTDLVLTAQFKSEQVCEAINKLSGFASGVPDMTGILYENTFSTEGVYQGTYTASIILRTDLDPVFNEKTTGCFYQGDPAITHQVFPKYIFYHLLLAR